MTRRGFTLAEILISILIFTVVGMAMTTTLYTATNVFRGGEQARAAGDESSAVLAALRADLSRTVPRHLDGNQAAKDGGWLYAGVDGTGNCVLSWVIENPDPMLVKRDGSNARLLVSWYVSGTGADTELRRAEFAWSPNGGDRAGARNPVGATTYQVITRGCLHFGVWIDTADENFHRPLTATGPDWMAVDASGETIVPPWRTAGAYESELALPSGQLVPFPAALRISLILTGGGRHITRGTVINDTGTDLRIGGIRALPTVAGSLLRVENEWIAYDGFSQGTVRAAFTARGALRSVASTHNRGSDVYAGQFFALVYPLPH